MSVHLFKIDDPNEARQPSSKEGGDTSSEATATVIARFRAALEKVQAAELERLYGRLPKLNEQSREEIRQFSDRLVAKVLDPPVKSLGQESRNSSPQPLLDALQRLFQLNRIAEPLSLTEGLATITE
jgi:glutamyl-tRNA reductase